MGGAGFKSWPRDHKIAFWSVVVAAAGVLVAVVAVVVPAVTGGGSGTSNVSNVGANDGQINQDSTVVNNNYTGLPSGADPNPAGPNVESNSCPVQESPQKGSIATLAVDMFVRQYRDGECWGTATTIGLTPSTVEFEIRYVNTSKVVQNDVEFRIQFPDGLQMVPKTTYIKDSTYPSGVHIDTDELGRNGIVIGSYASGAAGYVAFEAETPALGDLKCGSNVFRTIAYVQPKSLDYFYIPLMST